MMPSPQTQEHAPNGLSYVEELPSDFTECTVFLDVDGTLAPDGSFDFSPAVLAKVGEWKQTNEVLLCTNKRGKERWQKLESLFGLPVVTKEHRKPSKKVLQGIRPRFAQLVVIGDKFLTDALFAKRIGARFIAVKRKLSGQETLGVQLVNFVDDLFSQKKR